MGSRGGRKLILPLVLALGVLIWFFVSIGGSEREGTQRAQASRGRDGVQAAELGLQEGPDAQSPQERLVVEDEALHPTPAHEASAFLHEPVPEHGVSVHVLVGRSDEPVPFASVLHAPSTPARMQDRFEEDAHGVDLAASLERRGLRYLADEHGVARVPLQRRNALVACAADGLWGFLEYSSSKERVELRLFPDETLNVKVVAGDERRPVRAAGVAIHYQWVGGSQFLATKETDANGEVQFPHVRQYGRHYWSHTEELSVRIAGLHTGGPSVAFSPWGPPESIELRMPPTCSVNVEVLDANGRLYELPALVRVARAGEDPFDDDGQTVARTTVSGSALFDQIGPGLDLLITVETADRHAVEAVAAHSPAAGASLGLQVRLGSSQSVLTGRILDERGAALALRQVIGKIGSSTRYLQSAEDGSFRVRVYGSQAKLSPLPLEFHVKPVDGEDLLVRLEIPGPLLPGVQDLGDLQLSESPILLEGRVLDADGRGLAGARIRVYEVNGERSRSQGHLGTTSRKDGYFTVRGLTQASMLSVRVSHPAAAGNKVERFPPGSRGIELSLASGGRIAGSVLFDEEWYVDFCQILVRPEGAEAWSHSIDVERPGHFQIDSVAAGRHDVRVCTTSETSHGVNVDGVVVVAGETTRDPRLAEVDLRGRARFVPLEIVQPDGTPVEDGVLYHRASGAFDWDAEQVYFDEGRAHIFTLLKEMDVYVAARGHRSTFLAGVTAGDRVVLDPGFPVHFRWSETPPPTKQRKLRVRIHTDSPDTPRQWTPFAVGTAEKPRPLALPQAGRYLAEYSVSVYDGQRRWEVLAKGEQSFDVHEQTEPQDIVLTLPQDLRDVLQTE